MPITVRWDNEAQTTVYFGVDGEYTSADMLKANQELEMLTQQVKHKIGVIRDLSKIQVSIENLVTTTWDGRTVIRGDYGTSRQNESISLSNPVAITVFIIPNEFLASLGNTFRAMLAAFPAYRNSEIVASIDDARSAISRYLSSTND